MDAVIFEILVNKKHVHKDYKLKKREPLLEGFPLFGVDGGTRTHDIQNHNLTL